MARGVVANRILRLLVFQLTAILFFVSLLTTAVPHKTQAIVPAEYRWTKTFGLAEDAAAQGTALATDPQGNIFIGGNFSGSVTFDGEGGSDSITDEGMPDIFISKRSSAGTDIWTRSISHNLYSLSLEDLATDSQGNVYVTGRFTGEITFGEGDTFDTGDPFKNNTYVTKYSSSGVYQWTKVFDVTSGTARGTGVAVDSGGNIYICGTFTGTVAFDGPGGSETGAGGTDGNSFLVKYTNEGLYEWSNAFSLGAGAYVEAYSVDVDHLGNVYIAGSFLGTVTFDGGGGVDTKDGLDGNAFLSKYDSDGGYIQTRVFGIETGNAAEIYDIAVDSDNNVYAIGGFYGTVTFDGEGGSDTRISDASTGLYYLTKYTSSGDYSWTKTSYIAPENVEGSAIESLSVAIDSEDSVYVTGDFYGTVTFDGEGGSDTKSAPTNNTCTTKYSPDGSYSWTKVFGLGLVPEGSMAFSRAMELSPEDNIYTLGSFSGTVTFDGEGGSDTRSIPITQTGTFFTSYGDAPEDSSPPGENDTPTQNQIITSDDIGQIFSGSGGGETSITETTTPKINENILPNPDGANLETAPIKNKGSNLYKWLIATAGTMTVLYLLFWRRRHNQQEE